MKMILLAITYVLRRWGGLRDRCFASESGSFLPVVAFRQ